MALSENRVMVGSPGKGGWPTVRFFNKKTGTKGEAYVKRTGDAMCTELGPGKPHLHNLIREKCGPEVKEEANKAEL